MLCRAVKANKHTLNLPGRDAPMSGGMAWRTACFGYSGVRGISVSMSFQRPGA